MDYRIAGHVRWIVSYFGAQVASDFLLRGFQGSCLPVGLQIVQSITSFRRKEGIVYIVCAAVQELNINCYNTDIYQMEWWFLNSSPVVGAVGFLLSYSGTAC